MKLTSILICIFSFIALSCTSETKEKNISSNEEKELISKEEQEHITIIPISHATLILEHKNDIIYVDPTGGAKAFEGQKEPTLILITDIHHDHLDIATLAELNLNNVTIIAPQAVVDMLDTTIKAKITVLNNEETKTVNHINIEAIAMYNLREEALKFHTKGRGNGYVLTLANQRIYISGDTEDIPEMRHLKNIDIAFVCMNLPYTMTVESAVSAVLDFAPKHVYPFHYRGTEGLSDVVKFKELVNASNSDIDVVQLNWYPTI